MPEHRAAIHWTRATPDFTLPTFCRDHSVDFGTGQSLDLSSTLELRGNPARVNPEELLVAAVASCQMMAFLAVAARQGWIVNAYTDQAVGWLEKNSEGRLAVTRIRLQPRVTFGTEHAPEPAALRKLHEQAHRGCFIAASVRAEITIEPAVH